VPDDHDDARRIEGGRGVEHVPDERSTAHRVQHLGETRPHAGALTRGEDDDGQLGR
jgi:hypothetical protein